MTDTSELAERYDTGLLPEGDHDQDWWQTAMRHELDRAHEFYAQAIERLEARVSTLEAYSRGLIGREDVTVGHLVERAKKAERELEIVTASLTDQETENERLREQLAEARARDEDRQEAIRAVLKVLPTQREPHPDDDLQKLVNLACSLLDDALTDYAPEALAAPAPSTGEAERLKALGNAEQIAANRAANTTDPREAAVASRIANDIKQLRE